MSQKNRENIYKLDEKDCKILDILQKNCRTPLTKIAKEVGLSIDSVKKRMDKMIVGKIFYPKIQLRPRNFGFTNIVEVKVKLQYADEMEMNKFINYLKNHPHIVEILSLSGEYDLTIVMIAGDAIELGKITANIRNRFGKLISAWNASLTVNSHKFEEYSMEKLIFG